MSSRFRVVSWMYQSDAHIEDMLNENVLPDERLVSFESLIDVFPRIRLVLERGLDTGAGNP